MVGHPLFDRAVRVQANTLEQMPIFLPSLWLAAICHGDAPAAAIGLGFVAFHILYTVLYLRSPERRGYGYVGSTICLPALWALAPRGALTKGTSRRPEAEARLPRLRRASEYRT